MKRFLLLIIACCCFFSVHAAYLKDVPKTLTQPDGTILHCFASGDEFFNYLHDADGYTIMQHPLTGFYVYADKQNGQLVATDFVAGSVNPASKNLRPYNLISPQEWQARRNAWHENDRQVSNRSNPNHGTLNNISIFIRFSDDGEFVNSYSSIDNMFNDVSENGISMRNYFRSASYGSIEIPTYFYPGHSGETIISYQDNHPRSYFQPYNAVTNTNGYQTEDQRAEREFSLLERAVNYINANYPIPSNLNIDYDNDGYVDNVCFIVRGDVGEWSSLLWPHKWALQDRYVYINGKIVWTFNFQLADASGYFNTSTMCHEMNHSLGAPDLYHYSYTGPTPVGIWDLMQNNTMPPQHCGAYMKMKYGLWIDEIPEITEGGTYTLNPISSPTPDNVAYKIATEDPYQFYVLEYRDNTSLFDAGLPGSGLLIYRIDTRFDGNASYDPSSGIYDEVYIFRPGGSTTMEGDLSSAFFSANVGRTEFNASTSAYPFFTNGTVDNNFGIYNITQAGNTISFSYGSVADCEPPTNLMAFVENNDVALSWTAAVGAVSYNVYRNGSLIGNTTETSYLDGSPVFGTQTYYVKSMDSNGFLSSASESVEVNYEPEGAVFIGDGGTATNVYLPSYSYYCYTLSQQIYTAEEIGTQGNIRSISFYNEGAEKTRIYDIYLVATDKTAFQNNTDWIPVTASDLVFSGDVLMGQGWNTITLDDPFVYMGDSNLALIVDDNTGSWTDEPHMACRVFETDEVQAMHVYNDSPNYDPYNPFSYSGTRYMQKNQIVLIVDQTSSTPVVIPETCELGYRPNGAWVRPFTFQIYNPGDYCVINSVSTDNDYFQLEEVEFPFSLGRDASREFNLMTGNSDGETDGHLIINYGDNEVIQVDLSAFAYNPVEPDVWEMARVVDDPTDYRDTPTTAMLNNDYFLPPTGVSEGNDAVYKVTFDHDVLLNGTVTKPGTDEPAENGKLVVYREGFEGVGGPDFENYYGPQIGFSPYDIILGDGTGTNNYQPCYALYNNSLTEQLYLAEDLLDAGMSAGVINAIGYYTASSFNYDIGTVRIYMANVADVAASSTSTPASNMTLVCETDNVYPMVGWNDFELNGNFEWDGTSNLLVMFQRNHSEWHSGLTWQYTAQSYTAGAYAYSDGTSYNPQTSTYSLTTTTNLPNTHFVGNNRNRDRQDGNELTYNFDDGTLQGWTAIDANNDGYNWFASSSYGSNSGSYAAVSESYRGALSPDNYLVSPQVTLGTGASISFYEASYYGYEEPIYLMVSTTGTNPSDFTSIQNWTFSNNHQNGFELQTVDLSAYAGQQVYLAFRHYGSYDQYKILIDDITINLGQSGPGPEPGPTVAIENMTMLPGTYYVVASSTEDEWDVVLNTGELPCPEVASHPTPSDYDTDVTPTAVQLKWRLGERTTEYQLLLGTDYENLNVIVDWTRDLAETYTLTGLPNNANCFWQIVERNDGCFEGVEGPVWGFTTLLNGPQDVFAYDSDLFEGDDLTLEWTPLADTNILSYNIYQDNVLVGNTTDSYYTVSGLTYNMDGYNFYVTAVYAGGESNASETVTVFVSGNGAVEGHVYEVDGITGIANATVSLSGYDEFGYYNTYSFTTDANGYYIGILRTGSYSAIVTCAGYQESRYNNLVNIVYNQTTTDVDIVMDEVFLPVAEVVAEYYPDSEDPESPYVKVYWENKSAMVEDFEIGSFSRFDWNISGDYPFEITTTNPYEGTYCMQSTNYNVGSSTSSIDVTVEIPRDGLMSFYKRISCESSWDNAYFYVDGVQVATFTGESGWGIKEVAVTEGTHNFKWAYTKNGSVDSGEDRFFIDYIDFIHDAQPAQPGWHTYCEGEFDNALGSNLTTTPSWGYLYPNGGGYAGMRLTKVALFSDNQYTAVGGNYTCTIYTGGATPDQGTPVSTMTVDVPSNQNAWVEFDLTTPVAVSDNENLWVIWTANTSVSNWPAGLAAGSEANGSWWNAGESWEQVANSFGVFTMKNYFTNRSGRTVEATYATTSESTNQNIPIQFAPATPAMASTSNDGNATTVLNPNLVRSEVKSNNRSFNHYRVYRTSAYNNGPYTEDNTVVVADNLADTLLIDLAWADAEAGVYKWGVSRVYEGNRGEMIETPVNWANLVTPASRNTNEGRMLMAVGTPYKIESDENTRNEQYIQYCTETYSGGVGTGGGEVWWGIKISAAQLGDYIGQYLTKLGVFTNIDGDNGYTYSGYYTAEVYAGSTPMATTLVSTATEYIPGDLAWHDIELTTPITINGSDDLWLCFHTPDIAYPMSGCDYIGEPNSDFLSLDGTTWEHSCDYGLNYTWMIRGFVDVGNTIQGPRESQIVWSNFMDKNMNLGEGDVDITVMLNSGDSPEGVTVSFSNLNSAEQQLYPIAPVTLDGSGYYAWDSFRKGDYQVQVSFDGYSTIAETVSIWDATSLNYMLSEIINGISDLYVSRTGWAMWTDEQHGNTIPSLDEGDTFFVDFEDSQMPDGWTTIDADGDGYNWRLNTEMSGLTGGHDGSTNFVFSQSYDNNNGVIYPDNYFVSPRCKIVDGSTFSFWACAQDASYGAEHFGVAISTTDNTSASDFTTIFEHTITSKGGRQGGERDMRAQSTWRQYAVDLSAYAGQQVYIAIRHFNCYDQFYLNVDDIQLSDRNTEFTEGFENGLNGWHVLNVIADGGTWIHSDDNLGGYDYTALAHTGTGFAMGYSFVDNIGACNIDSYMYSPCKFSIVNGSTLTFWADNANDSYPENFSVCIATADNPTAADFTQVWSGGAKGNNGARDAVRHSNNRYENWRQHTIDLSAYAGQKVYIAFHDVNYDMYEVWIDDVQLTAGAKANRHFDNYQVILSDTEDNVIYQGAVSDCFMQLPVDDLIDGQTYHLKVASVYSSGLSEWSETDWAYQSCDNFESVSDLNLQMSDTANVISWTYPTVGVRSFVRGDYPAYGCMVYNDGVAEYQNGWFSFDLDTPGAYNYISTDPYVFGGDYCPLDGNVHATYNNNWYVINPETGEIVNQGSLNIYDFYDCAWDYSSGMMYGVYGSDLYMWNVEDNTIVNIGSMGRTMMALACDLDGQLWGISQSEGALYKIDKTTGATTFVGSTGQYCYYVQSAGFDHYTGKLYWTGCGDSGFFAEVDTETGQATVLANNTGEVCSFCVPFDGGNYFSPVTGIVGAMLYRDGELLGYTTRNSYTDTEATGNHEYEVRVVYDGMRRCPNYNAYYAMSCPLSVGGASYEVTVTANPTQGGVTTGAGSYINGFPCTVTATANEGYAFTNWSMDGDEITDTPEYTFRVRDNVNMEANFIGITPHWEVVDNPEYNSQSLIGVVNVNGIELTGNYVEVAALCGDECRGRQMLTYYPEQNRFVVCMTIYGLEGDNITFGLYDHERGEETEFDCLSVLTFNSTSVVGTLDDPYIIRFGITQTTDLQAGWNWYSTIVKQEGSEGLEMLEASLGADGVMIKSQDDGFDYNYGNLWMGNLNFIANDQMYMINANAPVEAVISGISANVDDCPITLYSGWSWIGYPHAVAMDINEALANLNATKGDVLKTKHAFSTYIEGQGWFGTLNTLEPAMGMMYNSKRVGTTTFTYSDALFRDELVPNLTAENNHWVSNDFKYPDNMSVMAVVELNQIEIADGDYELAVFANGICLGSSKLIYVEPINRYMAFLTITGEENQEMNFGLYHAGAGKEYQSASEMLTFVPNAIVGSIDEPYIVHFNGSSDLVEGFASARIYPNPVERGALFSIDLSTDKAESIMVEVINALGETVSVLRSSQTPIVVKAPNVSGVYTVRLVVEGKGAYSQKLIVK